jgi:hypothetical protein
MMNRSFVGHSDDKAGAWSCEGQAACRKERQGANIRAMQICSLSFDNPEVFEASNNWCGNQARRRQ